MATSDLGIMPTLDTSLSYKLELGNKFFQYIAAGIPIGSSDQPVKKRLITKYDLGIIFDIENPEDVAERFNLLVEDKVRYRELKLNVLEAQKVFNWETEEKKLFHVYDNLFKR